MNGVRGVLADCPCSGQRGPQLRKAVPAGQGLRLATHTAQPWELLRGETAHLAVPSTAWQVRGLAATPAPHSLLGLGAAWLVSHQEGTRSALASRSLTEGAGGRCSSQWRAEPAEPSGGRRLGNGEKTGPFGLCCENSYPSVKQSPVPRALDSTSPRTSCPTPGH